MTKIEVIQIIINVCSDGDDSKIVEDRVLQESWDHYTKLLCADRLISLYEYKTWGNPFISREQNGSSTS